MAEKKETPKFGYVQLRDKTSSLWLRSQDLTISCDKPEKVRITNQVKQALMNKVLIEVDKKAYDDYNKKSNPQPPKANSGSGSNTGGGNSGTAVVDAVKLAIEKKVVEKKEEGFVFGETKLGASFDDVVKAVTDDKKVLADINKAVKATK